MILRYWGENMAKKKNLKKASPKVQEAENALPQNIVLVGDRIEENKNVYISQPVYKEIHNFTKNKTTNESGGMLVGKVIEEFGKVNIIIGGFVEAKYCDATPTTLKFTHETWSYVHKEVDKKFPGQKIVGWIHTHPNFGTFLSEYDRFIQDNFFNEAYQVAYVIDPIQGEEDFFVWVSGKLEKSRGFYKFDKPGKKLTERKEADTPAEKPAGKSPMIHLLTALVAILVIICALQGNKIRILQENQYQLETAINQAYAMIQDLYMQLQPAEPGEGEISDDITVDVPETDEGGKENE